MRPIDADVVCNMCLCDYTRCPSAESGDCIIKDAPTLTLDDLRPKGRWDVTEDEFMTYARCSECGEDFSFWEADCALTNFCPSCGADMRGGGSDA